MDWQIGDVKAFILESPAAIKHTLVVNLSCNDMFLSVFVEMSNTLDSQIVALCGTTSENDLLSLSPNQVCNILSYVSAIIILPLWLPHMQPQLSSQRYET